MILPLFFSFSRTVSAFWRVSLRAWLFLSLSLSLLNPLYLRARLFLFLFLSFHISSVSLSLLLTIYNLSLYLFPQCLNHFFLFRSSSNMPLSISPYLSHSLHVSHFLHVSLSLSFTLFQSPSKKELSSLKMQLNHFTKVD